MSFISVILSAGMGTRMKSRVPKVLHEVCGKPLTRWVIEASKNAGADEIVTVIGHKGETVREALDGLTEFAVQSEQLGTGHAVMQAGEYIKKCAGFVVILNGDAPLITAKTIENAVRYHADSGNSATVITAVLEDSTGYGRIVRDADGNVLKIVEQKDADAEELLIKEINSGMYVFGADKLAYALEKITPNNAQGEYYLTDTLAILLENGNKIGAYTLEDNDEIRGINDRLQLSEAEKIMRKRINNRHMLGGVTMRDPDNTYIEDTVEIDPDVIIEANVSLSGNTKICGGAVIGSGSKIINSRIGSGTEVMSSVITDSTVGENSHIGPFAYIRPGSEVGGNVKVGDFVELKNAVIGSGTKISHLTYIGDSDVGENVNFGCGCVTVNYDGKKKYRTVVEDNAFIGCNTNLVSPVTVRKNAYIAAGSTITDEVPENSLAVARSRQVVKTDWKDKR
ncbi:MAG: bifunctional UDP-N-acetylglucosamine diphosphorylase/glucosamine-1-phosphate N-acetyltransferase GlmU [Oscillospiraceae bacterium]|nr:bifunctional UDP-N-acetylglucosamine diphosphorylase/glucosamine-1-phosphate N-acetyltransferase GlmU [Oscillospiraceae bacterium]